ncbi:MAG: EthD domain-containing protein, partial [Rhizorhabdus sp.]
MKLFTAIPRRDDVSTQFFHDHWRHPHGTWACRVQPMRHYVQSHRIDSELLGNDQRRIEGVAECWMDNVADVLSVPGHPDFADFVLPDEPLFIDQSGLRFVVTHEDVISSGRSGPASNDADDAWDAET